MGSSSDSACPAVAGKDPVSDDLWDAIPPLVAEPGRHRG
jgi:hypothetical protein